MNYIKNYSKNLITILTIFSTNLYTLEGKSMNQRATELNLNDEQFERLKELYVETIVDSMSMEDLLDYVRTDYYNSLDKYNEFDLFEDIKYTLDEEFLDEFIKQIRGKITD